MASPTVMFSAPLSDGLTSFSLPPGSANHSLSYPRPKSSPSSPTSSPPPASSSSAASQRASPTPQAAMTLSSLKNSLRLSAAGSRSGFTPSSRFSRPDFRIRYDKTSKQSRVKLEPSNPGSSLIAGHNKLFAASFERACGARPKSSHSSPPRAPRGELGGGGTCDGDMKDGKETLKRLQSQFVDGVDGEQIVRALQEESEALRSEKAALEEALRSAVAAKSDEIKKKEELEGLLEEGCSGGKLRASGGLAAKKRAHKTPPAAGTAASRAVAMELKRTSLQNFLFLGKVDALPATHQAQKEKLIAAKDEREATQEAPGAAVAPAVPTTAPVALGLGGGAGRKASPSPERAVRKGVARRTSPSPERSTSGGRASPPTVAQPQPPTTTEKRIDDVIMETTLDIKRLEGVRARLAAKKDEVRRDIEECKRGWMRAAMIIEKEIERIRAERAVNAAQEAVEKVKMNDEDYGSAIVSSFEQEEHDAEEEGGDDDDMLAGGAGGSYEQDQVEEREEQEREFRNGLLTREEGGQEGEAEDAGVVGERSESEKEIFLSVSEAAAAFSASFASVTSNEAVVSGDTIGHHERTLDSKFEAVRAERAIVQELGKVGEGERDAGWGAVLGSFGSNEQEGEEEEGEELGDEDEEDEKAKTFSFEDDDEEGRDEDDDESL